jgi:hypothetical protein
MLHADAIRSLFLDPRATYPVADAASLLGIGWRDMRAWLESGELEGLDTNAGLVLPWGELVSFAMDFWSQATVEEALGEDVAAAIPELVRLINLEVRLPRFEVAALERVAVREGKTVDALLARELLDFASAHAIWLAGEIPGFGEALSWPEPV